MPVEFYGEVVSLQVKSKKATARVLNEAGKPEVIEVVQKIGRILLEFNADSVDVTRLARFIQDQPVRLELGSTQERFTE